MSSDRLSTTFAALADPTRRAILARLALGEASVAELAKPFAISQPAVSKHLKILERAGLVTGARDAQRRPRRIAGPPLAEAASWIDRFREIWEGNYRRLDTLLVELQAEEAKPRGARTSKGDQK
jgi:DNA-binding transcriptional ArsR family regulator